MNPILAHPPATLLSIQDAIFPVHPFSGVFALGRENNWRLPEMFPGFALDKDGNPDSQARISYVQAREGLLQARWLGGTDLGILSGSRKTLAALGGMGAGLLAQANAGQALAFGLEYQMIAGAMAQLQLAVGEKHSDLASNALFDDRELQDFLDLDHLATALNVARSFPGNPLRPERVELRGNQHLSASLAQDFFGCKVITGADLSRIVFATAGLDQPLYPQAVPAAPDGLDSILLRQACERQLASMGVAGKKSLVRTLIEFQCESRSVPQMAEKLGLSSRSLYRLLAREATSYFEIAEAVRMDAAKRLLQEGLSTEQVAEQLAYADARSFRRAFKRCSAMTPSEYRQALQK